MVPRGGEGLAQAAPDGIDAVIDVVAGPQVDALLPQVRVGGRWVVAGAVADPVVRLDLRRLYLGNRRLVGSTMHTAAHFAALAEEARAGSLSPRVSRSYDLEQIHEAHAELATRDHVGKIVVRPGR